jgi:guanylate kinase
MSFKVFIISGPGGAGKTTLVSQLFQKKYIRDNFKRSISYTTRQARQGEINGKDYWFVNEKIFTRLRDNNELLEWEQVAGNFYGTPKKLCQQARKEHKDFVLCIDVNGATHLKNTYRLARIISIFIIVPSVKELYSRFKKRGENISVINRRMALAKKELKFIRYYDYVVVNKDISQAVQQLETIFKAEQLRRQ